MRTGFSLIGQLLHGDLSRSSLTRRRPGARSAKEGPSWRRGRAADTLRARAWRAAFSCAAASAAAPAA